MNWIFDPSKPKGPLNFKRCLHRRCGCQTRSCPEKRDSLPLQLWAAENELTEIYMFSRLQFDSIKSLLLEYAKDPVESYRYKDGKDRDAVRHVRHSGETLLSLFLLVCGEPKNLKPTKAKGRTRKVCGLSKIERHAKAVQQNEIFKHSTRRTPSSIEQR